MILGKHYGIHGVDRLRARLAKSSIAVARVSIDGHPLCSGFFITDRLIVVPGFVFEKVSPSRQEVVAECFRNGKRVWRQVITPPFEMLKAAPEAMPPFWNSDRPLLTLLRVAAKPARPISSRDSLPEEGDDDGVCELAFETPETGQFVAVVQFHKGGNKQGVSFGALRAADANVIAYDADTEPGASGGPVLDANWRVMGMHYRTDAKERVNQAVSVAAMIAALRASRSWKRIKDRHRIADVAAAQQKIAVELLAAEKEQPAPLLVTAALSAALDKNGLTDEDAKLLRELVVDPSADRWVLRSSERERILRAAGSLGQLKDFVRVTTESPGDRTVQSVIERILAGPPYDLGEFDENELSAWIQVSRWFAGVHPAIPSPAQVTRALERKRARSRLDVIAGADFRGRTKELDLLRRWWKKSTSPLSITGIGGIGKSALVARFASQLPQKTLLLWLDFDRADLAPDDAPSVLSAIAKQASVQLDRFRSPDVDVADWEKFAVALGERLQEALPYGAVPLLVLDSFEAAQYAAKYQELWPVLELLAKALPRLRLLVTGRAPVPELSLAGRRAEAIHLQGLERPDARRWLQKHGVQDAAVLKRVLNLAAGVPLILRLALRLIEKGGKVEDLPETLPPEIVAGYLYDRILDRVQNQTFKPVAMAALVLRRLSADMVLPLFQGLVALPSEDVSSWFSDLARELALVEGTDVLRLRPEVRTAALSMVERDRPELVHSIDQRAAEWYAKQPLADPEIAAELVYHRLRLDDVKGAEEAWRDECGRFLTGAAAELPPASRKWLQARLGVAEGDATEFREAADAEAAERIRAARSRGHARAVQGILSERGQYADDSPLIFQEAYELWRNGDAAAALERLNTTAPATGIVQRDRDVLRALLLAQSGEVIQADSLLAPYEAEQQWADRFGEWLYPLAIRAARVELTVDFGCECLVIMNPFLLPTAFRALTPLDVLLPRLSDLLWADAQVVEAAVAGVFVDPSDLPQFKSELEKVRLQDGEPALLTTQRRSMQQQWNEHGVWEADHDWSTPTIAPIIAPVIAKLLEKAWRRWWLFSTSSFVAAAKKMAVPPQQQALASCTGRTRALLEFPRRLLGPAGFIDFGLAAAPPLGPRIDEARWPRVRQILHDGIDPERNWDNDVRKDIVSSTGKSVMTFVSDLSSFGPHPRAILIHLFSPDPLETVVHELAGSPPA